MLEYLSFTGDAKLLSELVDIAKEINTDITQKRSEERMKPRLSKKDLLATDEPAPKKKNAFKK